MYKSLRNFEEFLFRSFYFFHRNAVQVIIITILLFSYFAYQMKNMTQAVSFVDQMDPEIESTKNIKTIKKIFAQNSSIGFIALKPDHSVLDSSSLCELQLKTNDTVLKSPNIQNFISPYKLRYAHQTYEGNPPQLIYKRVLENPCEPNNEGINPLEPLSKTPWKNLFSGHDLRDIAYNFTFFETEANTRYGHFDPDQVENFMTLIEKNIYFKIFWTGPEVMQLYTIKGLDQSQWLNFILIAIIWISLRLYFGTWRSGAIFIATLFFTTTIVFGGMSLFGHPMDMLSSCLFLLLAISSLEDFIFVAQHQLENNTTYIDSHLKIITPGFFTSLTTILGFGSLMISDLEAIRRFGAWATVGAFVEWVTVFLIIPAFMHKFVSLQNWVDQTRAISIKKTKAFALKTPPRLFSHLLLLVFIFSIFAVKNFRLSQTPSEMFPKNHPYQKMIDYVRTNRGWEADASLVFNSEINQEFKINIINKLKENKIIKQVETYSEILDYVRHEIHDQSTKDMIKSEFESANFSKRYLSDDHQERALLYLSTTNTEKINKLRDQVKSLCPHQECFISGEIIGFADFSKSLIHTLFESLFVSLILVGVVISYLAYTTKINNIASLLLTSFWGPAVLLCLIYIFNLSINFVTCIIASTLVGLTGDNAVQFIFAGTDRGLAQGIDERGPSSFYCSLTMALCSLVFLGSYFDAPKVLGVLLALGFLFSFIGDVWILKGMVKNDSK